MHIVTIKYTGNNLTHDNLNLGSLNPFKGPLRITFKITAKQKFIFPFSIKSNKNIWQKKIIFVCVCILQHFNIDRY